jgi:hypothetical protein
LERDGISQEVDRTKPERRTAVSMHRHTSFSISAREAHSNRVAATFPIAAARPRDAFMNRAS